MKRCLAALVATTPLVLLVNPNVAATVAIDVGHYFAEPGAISARGRAEFEFNLELARVIEAELRARGHAARLIGADGMMKELSPRPRAANGADLLISVHHDSARERFLSRWTYEGVERRYSDRFSGFSLFVSRDNPELEKSLRCAAAIGAALKTAGFVPSLYHADPAYGENRPFADKSNGVHYFDNLAVVRHATMPALLLEAGVIVNREEELQMRDPGVQRRAAAGAADGVEKCLKKSEGEK